MENVEINMNEFELSTQQIDSIAYFLYDAICCNLREEKADGRKN